MHKLYFDWNTNPEMQFESYHQLHSECNNTEEKSIKTRHSYNFRSTKHFSENYTQQVSNEFFSESELVSNSLTQVVNKNRNSPVHRINQPNNGIFKTMMQIYIIFFSLLSL